MAAILATAIAGGTAGAASADQLVGITIGAAAGEIPQSAISYAGPPRANVLLPDNYDPSRAYPLLLLLHGLNDNYGSWGVPKLGDVAGIAKGLGAIVVMPEGAAGWYTDWWNGGKRGGPSWETYILDRVLPAIQQRYKIRPQRRYHAIAGVSMGGLGATYLGGRLPGYFGSVASLSGFVDPQMAFVVPDAMAIVSGGIPPAVEGPDGGFYANGHNPSKLVANLAQSRVFVTVGNGLPDAAAFADPSGLPVGIAEEDIVRPMTDTFVRALRTAGVDATYDAEGGLHLWPYFRDELRRAIAWGLFKPVDATPSSWVNDTVATHGQLWDLNYRFDTPPDGVVRFRRVGNSLHVTGAHDTVTLTTTGGCVLHAALPADLTVPARSCARRSALLGGSTQAIWMMLH